MKSLRRSAKMRAALSIGIWCLGQSLGPDRAALASATGLRAPALGQALARVEKLRLDPAWAALLDRCATAWGGVPPLEPRLCHLSRALGADFTLAAADLELARAQALTGTHRLMLDPALPRAALIWAGEPEPFPTDHALLWLAAGMLDFAPEPSAYRLRIAGPRRVASLRELPQADVVPPAKGRWAEEALRAKARRVALAFETAGLSAEGEIGLLAARDRLGPSLWAVARDCLGRAHPRERVERDMGLPGRSAKALLLAAVELWPEETGND
ncbi:hypothetical protein ACSSV4_000622 [Roseovarius sp. MBR-154]|jgi:hypothetical protein